MKIIFLKKLNYSWSFFGGNLLLCASFSWVIASDISCRIPFSRFLSHFHYGNLLSLWCIVGRSLLTLSFLSWMERVANHLSSLLLTDSASTPEHCSASSFSLNGLKIDLPDIASLQRKLNTVFYWSCIEMKWHIFSYLVQSFDQILGGWAFKMSPILTGWHVSKSSVMLLWRTKILHAERPTWRRIPILIFSLDSQQCPWD